MDFLDESYICGDECMPWTAHCFGRMTPIAKLEY